jgi:cell division protein FtsB
MLMKSVWNARKKVIGIAAIILLLMLMMNLNTRLGEYFRLVSERDVVSTQIIYDQMTRVALETRVAYASSEQAVEDWARNDAHMIRPGDKFVVPVTPVGQTPQPQIEVTPTQTPVENWEVWWELFFSR